MKNKYKGRVEETIHQLVAALIVRRVKDPRVENVSIIRVSVSGDYSVAKLYYNIIGGSDDLQDVESGLKSAKVYIRNKIKKHLRLRVIPELIFIYDSSLDKAMALEKIIDGIHEEEPLKESDSAEENSEEGMDNG